MTCVVGYIDKENKKTYIGGDSAASWQSNIRIRKDEKVFKNGDFIFGCTGSFRMMQLLRYSFVPPNMFDEDVFQYMCTLFIDDIRQCFGKAGFMQKYNGNSKWEENGNDKGGTFLVGYKDRLFKVEGDFQVGEILDNYDAIGSGEQYALGAVYNASSGASPYHPHEFIEIGLRAAVKFTNNVQGPFNIIST